MLSHSCLKKVQYGQEIKAFSLELSQVLKNYIDHFKLFYAVLLMQLFATNVSRVGCEMSTVLMIDITIYQFGFIEKKHLKHFLGWSCLKVSKALKVSHRLPCCNNNLVKKLLAIIIFDKCEGLSCNRVANLLLLLFHLEKLKIIETFAKLLCKISRAIFDAK